MSQMSNANTPGSRWLMLGFNAETAIDLTGDDDSDSCEIASLPASAFYTQPIPDCITNVMSTFVHVQQNVYNVSPTHNDDNECEPCVCELSDAQWFGCMDRCLNRSMNIECSASNCPCGERCGNQRLQQHHTPRFALKKAGDKGIGVFLMESVKAGTLIGEYVGEVISFDEYTRRSKLYQHLPHTHCLRMTNTIIDATRCGGLMRFVNHSCDANCSAEKWLVNGRERCGIFSLQYIENGEEVTFNYQTLANTSIVQTCCCCSVNCCGTMPGATAGDQLANKSAVLQLSQKSYKRFDEQVKGESRSFVSNGLPNHFAKKALLEILGGILPSEVRQKPGQRHLNAGEILPDGVSMLMGAIGKIDSSDIFLDIGAGVGNVIIQVALQTSVRQSIGIEIRNDVCLAGSDLMKRKLALYPDLCRVRMYCTDVASIDFAVTPWSESSILYCCNGVFESSVNTHIQHIVCNLQRIRFVAIFERFCWRHRQGCQKEFCRRFALISTLQVPVSWTGKLVSLYLYKSVGQGSQ